MKSYLSGMKVLTICSTTSFNLSIIKRNVKEDPENLLEVEREGR
jgi:hypothetical protein